MATRSFIGILNPDGSVNGVYCHHDGYLSGVGSMLTKNYTTPEKVRDLLALGDMSCLGDDLTTCEFYHRDRNEEMADPIKFATLELVKSSSDIGFEYWYVFTPKGWMYTTEKSGWETL